jgi:hypothetical protein
MINDDLRRVMQWIIPYVPIILAVGAFVSLAVGAWVRSVWVSLWAGVGAGMASLAFVAISRDQWGVGIVCVGVVMISLVEIHDNLIPRRAKRPSDHPI